MVSSLKAPSASVVAIGLALALAGCSGGVATIDGPAGSSGSSGATSGGTSGQPAPPSTPPATTFNGGANGCGNVFAYRANDDGSQFVVVQVERDQLGMKLGEKRSIDLANAPASVKVRVEIFASAPKDAQYCTDVRINPMVPSAWSAEAGTLDIELGTSQGTAQTYRATVRLKNVRFVGPERGTSVILQNIVIENVLVGWLAG